MVSEYCIHKHVIFAAIFPLSILGLIEARVN